MVHKKRESCRGWIPLADAVCYCRKETDEDTVKCCNPSCALQQFLLSCLGINTFPKTWYCPTCRALPEFKKRGSKQHSANSKPKLTYVSKHTKQTVTQTSTNTRPNLTHVTTNTNQTVTHVTSHSGQTVTHNTIHTKQTITHISTNTRPTVTHVTTNTNKTVTNPTVSSGTEEVTILKTVITNTFPRDKHELEGRLGHHEYGLIASPNG